MSVISNAGPLIALGKLGRLDILHKLYGVILVAQEVYEETVTRGIALGAPDADLIHDYFSKGILQTRHVQVAKLHDEMQIEEGEKATIELALEEKAEFVLMDDATAREVAERYGVKVKGTLGVILNAVERGILVRDEGVVLIQQIKRRRDIWIRESLCDLALERL